MYIERDMSLINPSCPRKFCINCTQVLCRIECIRALMPKHSLGTPQGPSRTRPGSEGQRWRRGAFGADPKGPMYPNSVHFGPRAPKP